MAAKTSKKISKTSTKSLVHFLFEVGTLRKIPRAHMQALFSADLSDNIASHSYRVTVIGYLLAQMEKADSQKVLLMCLFHDLGETRSGDQNWIHKKYVKVFDEEIIEDQFLRTLQDKVLFELITEYNKRTTKEAKIAKDADILDQVMLQMEYSHVGNKEAANWLKSDNKRGLLTTKSGKKLFREMQKQFPSQWWYNGLWTHKRR